MHILFFIHILTFQWIYLYDFLAHIIGLFLMLINLRSIRYYCYEDATHIFVISVLQVRNVGTNLRLPDHF